MTVLKSLKNTFKEHKALYTAGLILIALYILKPLLPHLSFLLLFSAFCGACCIIYGFLLHFEKAENRAAAVTAKALKYTALSLIAAFILSFVVIEARIIGGSRENERPCGYVIVLGGGVNGKEPSLALVKRLERAVEYLSDNPDCRAILCGGKGRGEQITEALAMKNYLVNKNVDPDRLILEQNSRDTRENIMYAYEIIKERGGAESVAVVTSDFHLYRTKLIMKKRGFENVCALSAETPNVPFLHTSLYLREYFSVILEYLNI